MATIKEVALAAAVSTATVSRVLAQPERVARETRERVQRTIEDLGFHPNAAAQSLRTSKVSRILLMVPEISNPFYSDIIRGAEEAAREAAYSIVLGNTHYDPEVENLYSLMVTRREVDGVVFLGDKVPGGLTDLVNRLGAAAPIVNGCEYSSDLGVSSVHIDNVRAGFDVIAFLLGLGHRNIGIVAGPRDGSISRDRLRGAMDAVAQLAHGQLTVEHVNSFSIDEGFAATEALLVRATPTAIFCFSDELAMGAAEVFRQIGYKCPADVSLVGFDDIRFARFTNPPLTTVSQPSREIGRCSVQKLLSILARQPHEIENIVLPHKLVLRGSVTRPRSQ